MEASARLATASMRARLLCWQLLIGCSVGSCSWAGCALGRGQCICGCSSLHHIAWRIRQSRARSMHGRSAIPLAGKGGGGWGLLHPSATVECVQYSGILWLLNECCNRTSEQLAQQSNVKSNDRVHSTLAARTGGVPIIHSLCSPSASGAVQRRRSTLIRLDHPDQQVPSSRKASRRSSSLPAMSLLTYQYP